MPFAMSDLTRKDETASKIPAPAKGFGALAGSGGGYSQVLCLPIEIIFWPAYFLTKRIQKKRKEKKEAREAQEAQAANTSSTADTTEGQDAKGEKEKEAAPTSGEPDPKGVPETPALDPKLEHHPDNPRVCDPDCPAYNKGIPCRIHQRKEPDRPTSPGLLAV
ncbi:hypothetical protein FALBO_16044 [Fusarium albosuccineum]|uniref:Uncharacterized protein n=1 Tax=Fusarium albosuccineum TaxID=1237068 RepID=A0A8H4KPG3_9HYPO|nr:hypothetical protein FALBO_16044 [Fusarium albosuccineum]